MGAHLRENRQTHIRVQNTHTSYSRQAHKLQQTSTQATADKQTSYSRQT